MNKVILKGNVGQDPEVKTFENGKVCKFSLATSESYKNKSGEKITNTTWHNLVFWGILCDTIGKYVHKGDQLLVEGKIVIRNYEDKSGITHWATEIVCNSFEFCSSAKEAKEPKSESKAERAEDDPSYIPENINQPDDLPY